MALVTKVAHDGGLTNIYDANPGNGTLVHGEGSACTLMFEGAHGASRVVSIHLDRHQLRGLIAALIEVSDGIEAAEQAKSPPPGGGLGAALLAAMAGARPSAALLAAMAGARPSNFSVEADDRQPAHEG